LRREAIVDAWELWRLSGLDEEYGPLGENFTGERETPGNVR